MVSELNLHGIELGLDIATALSVIGVYIGWRLGIKKERESQRKEQEDRNFLIILDSLKTLTPRVALMLRYMRTDPVDTMSLLKTIDELWPDLINFVAKNAYSSSEVFEITNRALKTYNKCMQNKQKSHALPLIIYSMIILHYELARTAKNETQAKEYVETLFDMTDFSKVKKEYDDYYNEFFPHN